MTSLAGWPLVTVCGLLGMLSGSLAADATHRWAGKGLHSRGRLGVRRRPPLGVDTLVQLLVAVVWALTAFVHGPTWKLPALLAVGWAIVVASVIDLEFRIIPNKLTYRLAPTLLVLIVAAAGLDGAWGDLRRALIAGLALPGGMLVLSEAFRLLRGQPGMGMGDVKLAVSLGLALGYLGTWEVVIAIYASVIAAVVVAFALILAGRAGLASRIPFGPYLALGTLVAVLGGRPLTGALRSWLGLA